MNQEFKTVEEGERLLLSKFELAPKENRSYSYSTKNPVTVFARHSEPCENTYCIKAGKNLNNDYVRWTATAAGYEFKANLLGETKIFTQNICNGTIKIEFLEHIK